jgi:hypothetical protein
MPTAQHPHVIRESVGRQEPSAAPLGARRERLAVEQSHRVAVVRGEHPSEGFECRGVLEGFKVAEPTEAASRQFPELDRGQVLGVEWVAALLRRRLREQVAPGIRVVHHWPQCATKHRHAEAECPCDGLQSAKSVAV